MALTEERKQELREKYFGDKKPETNKSTKGGADPFLERMRAAAGETAKPSLTTSIGEKFNERLRTSLDAGKALVRGEQGLMRTAFQVGGQNIGLVMDVAGEAAGAGLRYVPDFIREPVVNVANKSISAVAGTRGGQMAAEALRKGTEVYDEQVAQKYPGLDRDLRAAANVAQVLPVGKGASVAVRGVAQVGKTAARQTVKTGEKALRGVGAIKETAVRKIVDKVPARILPKQTPDELVGSIIQGETKDIPKAAKALSQIDVSEIKSYKDLSTKFAERITALTERVDEVLQNVSKRLRNSELARIEKVGEKTIKTNYVSKAMDHLEELYSKSESPADLERIKQLRSKMSSNGLSLKEVNDLAREYGRKQPGFNLNGTPSTSVTKQGYENVRKGIKETARDLLPDDTTRILDKNMSELITAKELTDQMIEKVNALTQKVAQKNIVEKLAKGVADGFNLITAGGPRQFLFSVLGLRNQGFKTLNALDLQERLPKLLRQLDDALKADSQQDLLKSLQKLKNGLGKQ